MSVAPAALLFLLLSTTASATLLPRLDLPDLVHSSKLIVQGRVLRHWSDWDKTHRYIWTHYTLEIQGTLKGNAPTSITISEPGGTATGTTMKMIGAPEYSDGEEVIVFLERTPIGYWRCHGWNQGKYTVMHSPLGQSRIRTNLVGLEFADRLKTKSPLTRLDGITLDEFQRLVRKEIK